MAIDSDDTMVLKKGQQAQADKRQQDLEKFMQVCLHMSSPYIVLSTSVPCVLIPCVPMPCVSCLKLDPQNCISCVIYCFGLLLGTAIVNVDIAGEEYLGKYLASTVLASFSVSQVSEVSFPNLCLLSTLSRHGLLLCQLVLL